MLSLLGFGTSRFRPEDYTTDAGKDNIVNLLVKANHLGVNYYDTWDAYGHGQCEEVLGYAFKRMQGAFYISTKSHDCFFDADDMRRRLEGSLRRLQVEKIHFYHMWRILNIAQFHKFIRKGGPYDGALQAQREGLIDHICFSAHCGGDEIAQIAASGYFEGVILSYNIINFKYREQGLLAAKKHGLGVAVMNPLGGGIIPHNAQAFSFAVHEGESISDVALNWCAANDAVTLVLSGMTNEQELHDNIASINKLGNFSALRTKEIEVQIKEQFNFLCNGCRYCEGCPKNIATYKLMLAYNAYILRTREPRAFFEEIGNWHAKLPREPYACDQCGLCEEKCSQHIPISAHIAELNMLIEQREKYLREGLERCFGEAENTRIGIYGAGEYAREMLLQYKAVYGKMNLQLTIFDSSPAKIGERLAPYAFAIHHPDHIPALGIQRLIIATEDYYDEIYRLVGKYEKDGVEITGFTLGKQYKKLDTEIT